MHSSPGLQQNGKGMVTNCIDSLCGAAMYMEHSGKHFREDERVAWLHGCCISYRISVVVQVTFNIGVVIIVKFTWIGAACMFVFPICSDWRFPNKTGLRRNCAAVFVLSICWVSCGDLLRKDGEVASSLIVWEMVPQPICITSAAGIVMAGVSFPYVVTACVAVFPSCLVMWGATKPGLRQLAVKLFVS